MSRNLESLAREAEVQYKNIGSVACPYFKGEVVFNRNGWSHLKFKSEYEARPHSDQFIRMKNIRFAAVILRKSSTLQEIRMKKVMVKVKTRNRRGEIFKRATYYGFLAIIQDGEHRKRFKVIVREIEGGQKHFWSIIPSWKNTKELKLYSGDLVND